MDISSLSEMALDGSALNVKMDELQQVVCLVSRLKDIQSNIDSILSILESGGALSLKEAKLVLESALSQKVAVAQAETLQEKVQLAVEFSKIAAPILESPTLEALPFAELQTALAGAAEFSSLHGFHTKDMKRLWELDAKMRVTWLSQCVLADGFKVVEPPQDGRLPLQCSDHSPLHPLKNKFSKEVQQQTQETRVPMSERPSLDDGEALLEVAVEMNVDERIRDRLFSAIDTGKTLREQFWRACQGDELLDPHELCPWMEEARRSPFFLDGVGALEAKLEKYKEWQQKAEEVRALQMFFFLFVVLSSGRHGRRNVCPVLKHISRRCLYAETDREMGCLLRLLGRFRFREFLRALLASF